MPHHLPLFITATILLILTPGPAVVYIMARSVSQGREAGLVSVLGLELGTLVNVTAAAFGLSALLLSSALLFSAVKYLGAGYLIFLGVRKLLSRESLQSGQNLPRESLRKIFWQGFFVNLFNPKTSLFFIAFLPQFVDEARGNATVQMLLLGALFVAMATVGDGLWALLAGSLGNWLRTRARLVKVLEKMAGTVYIGLGLATAFSGGRK